MSDNGVIREGFICPICKEDLESPDYLIAHFEKEHSEEQDILKSLKDLFGRAKKKILKIDEFDTSIFKNNVPKKKYGIETNIPQEIGKIRNHTENFRTIRRERLDHRIAETNKLIIRLDRLLRLQNTDRRSEEQKIVSWLDGTVVNRCPSCASSFNITRRQHHCRLCGSIMCNSCSHFLTPELARALVDPVNLESNQSNIPSQSYLDTLRICSHCMDMLICRRQMVIRQSFQPDICRLYEEIQKIKKDLQPLIEMYNKMYNFLTSGITTYELQDAQSLKSSIGKKAEALDLISKKIVELKLDSETPKFLTLQKAVKSATSHYIKESVLSLPVLPTPQEIEEIIKMRKKLESNVPSRPSVVNKVTIPTGWSPSNVHEKEREEASADPLVEQIKIVENYIRQAKEANRYDEVISLKENLRCLNEALRNQSVS